MSKSETLTEDEWQVRCLVTARFPGFTSDLRRRFWNIHEDFNGKLNTTEIVAKLDITAIDLTDMKTGGSSSQDFVSTLHIPAWLDAVLQYEEDLYKIKADAIDLLFQDAIGRNMKAVDATPKNNQVDQPDYYEHLIRYATWTDEEAVEFILGGRKEPDFSKQLKQLQIDKKSNDLLRHMVPQDVIRWAKEVGWKFNIPLNKLEILNRDVADYIQPKRLSSYNKFIMGVAIGKFNYDRSSNYSSTVTKIMETLKLGGHPLSREAVSSLLDYVADQLEE